ncbi:hypothetical protein DL546_007676 [Coniochaeta pulveracea]|uniref:Uncharacterized protein n=1 Tax=Coniochaeta pulveracea TaxID=177199 RepID=A0A420YFG3_9PEZI|nr:hypothetical protein DL546_007676 [Coniochaeta pulveracea]
MSNPAEDDDGLSEFPELAKVFDTLYVQEPTSSAQPGRLPNGRPMATAHRPRPKKSTSRSNTSQPSQPSQTPAPIPQSSSFNFQPVTSAPSVPIFNPLAANQTGIPAFVPRPPTVPAFTPQPTNPVSTTQLPMNMMVPQSIPGFTPQPRTPGPTTQRPMNEGVPVFIPQNIPSLGIPLSSSPITTSYTVYRNAEDDLIPFQRDVQIALEGKKALKKELGLKEIELENKIQELEEANVQVQGINDLEADLREQTREIDRLKGMIAYKNEDIKKLQDIVDGRLEEDSDGNDGDDDVDMDDGGKGAAAKTKTLKLKQALTVCEGKREMLEDVVKEQAEKIVQMQEVMEGRQIPDFWAKMRDLKATSKALGRRNQELEESSSESLEAHIKELEAQLAEAKEEATNNWEDYETAKKMQDLLTNENKNLRAVIAEGEGKQTEWAKGRIDRLEEQNGTLKAELEQKDRTIEELEQEVSNLFMGQDRSAENQDMEEECQIKLAKQRSDYDAILHAKGLEMERLVRHDEELVKAREIAERNLAQAQEEKSKVEKDLQEYKNENARLAQEAATYATQVEILQQQPAQAPGAQQNIATGNVETLNARLLEMTCTVAQVVTERDAAIAQRDAHLTQIEQLNAEIQRLHALGQGVEQKLNETYSNRDQVIKERDENEGNLLIAMTEIATLKQQLFHSQSQLTAAQQQGPAENVDALLTENIQLRQQLAHAQQAGQETAAIRQEIVRLKEKIEIVQKASEAIEAQRQEAVDELEEEQKKHRMAKAELGDAKARVPGLESQVQELQSQLAAAKDKQLALTTEDGKSMYNRLTILENDNAELLLQHSRDKIQRETDEIRVSGFTKEIAQLKAHLAAANTVSNANGQDGLNQELIKLHGQNQQLQADLAEAQKHLPAAKKLPLCDQEVRRQRDVLAQRDAEIVNLKAHCQRLENAYRELEHSRVPNDQLIAKKRSGQQYGPQVVMELKEQLTNMQVQLAMKHGPEINKKNAEIERLRAEVMRGKAEVLRLNTAKKSVEEEEAQRLFEENDELRKTIEELELELKFATKEPSDNGMDVTPPRANQNREEAVPMDTSMGDTPPKPDRSSEVGELQQEINGLYVQIRGLTAQNAEKKKELEEKTKTFEQEYARFNQVHAELSLKANQNIGNGATTEQVQQMQEDFKKKVQELEQAARKVADLEKALEDTQAYANKMYQELQEKQLKTEADLADCLAGKPGNHTQSAQTVQKLTVELEAARKELDEEKRKAEFQESRNGALVSINKQLKVDIKIANEEAEKEKSKGVDFESRLPQLQQEALDPTRNPALAEATQKIEELQKQLSQALGVKDAYDELEKQMPKLEIALEDGNNEIAALKKRLADCHEHGKKLEADLKTAKDKLLKARKAALKDNGHVEIVADLENKLTVLQAELEAEKNKLPPLPDSDDGSEGASILKETLEDCYKEGERVGAELRAKTEELESVRATLMATQSELQERTEDYSRVVKKEDEANRALTEAVAGLAYNRSFPHGHNRLPTSGDGLHCGLFAIIESVEAQMPHLPVPELSDLQRIIGTVTDDHNNFQAEHLHLTLRQWAEEQHIQQSLQLGIITPQTGYLVMREEGRDTLWLHNDEAIKLQNAGFNHYEGLAAKPCDASTVEAGNIQMLAQRTQERDVAMAQAEKQSEAIKAAEAKLANLANQEIECRTEMAALRLQVDTCHGEKTELEAKIAELAKQLTEQESQCAAEKTSFRQLLDNCNAGNGDLEARIAELQAQLGARQNEHDSPSDQQAAKAENKAGPSSEMNGSYQAPVFNFSVPQTQQAEKPEPEQQQRDTAPEQRSRAPSPEEGQATTDEQDQPQTETTRENRSRAPSPDISESTTETSDSSGQTQQDPVDVQPSVEATNESSDDTMDEDLPDYQSTPEKNTSDESPANPFGANPFGANPFGGASNPFGGTSNPFGGAGNPFGGAGNPFGGASNPFGGASNPFGAFPSTSTKGAPQKPSFNFQKPPPPPPFHFPPPPSGRATRGVHKQSRSGGRGGRPQAADFMGTGAGKKNPSGGPFGNGSGASSFFDYSANAFNSNPSGTDSTLQQQISDLNSRLFDARAECQRFEQDRSHYEEMWKKASQDTSELNEEVVRLKEVGEDEKAQLEKAMAELNARVGKLESEKAKLEVEVTRLEEKRAEQGKEHEKLLEMVRQGDGSKTTKLLSEMNARQEEKLRIQEEINKEQEESVDDCLEEIEILTEQLNAKTAEIEKLTESESKSSTTIADLQTEVEALKGEVRELKSYEGYKKAWITQHDQLGRAREDVQKLKRTIAKKEEEYEWASERMARLKEEKDINEKVVKQLGAQTIEWQKLIEAETAKKESLIMQLEKARTGERPSDGKTVDDMDDDELYAVEKVYKLEKLIERLLSYRFQREFMTGVFDKIFKQIWADHRGGIPVTKKHLKGLVVEEWLRQMSTILPPSEPSIPGWARTENLADGVVVDEKGEDLQSAENRKIHEQKLQDRAENNIVQRLKQEVQKLQAKLEDNSTASKTTNAPRDGQQGDFNELFEKVRVKDAEIAELKKKLAEALAAPTTLQDLHAVAHQILDRVNGFEVSSALPKEEENAAKQINKEARCRCCDCCKCKTDGAVVGGENGAAVSENIVNDLQGTVAELAKVMHDTVKDFQTELKQDITQERETLKQQVDRQREQFETKLDQEREKAELRLQLLADKAAQHSGQSAATGSGEHQVVPARSFGRRAWAVLFLAMAVTGWFVYLGMEASAALRTGVGSLYHYGRAQTHQVLVFENWEMFGLFELYQSTAASSWEKVWGSRMVEPTAEGKFREDSHGL